MANRHMKSAQHHLIIRKMKVKTTVRYHRILVRMTITEEKKEPLLVRIWRNWNPVTPLAGM